MSKLPSRNCSSAAMPSAASWIPSRSGWPTESCARCCAWWRNRPRSARGSASSRGCRARPACAHRSASTGLASMPSTPSSAGAAARRRQEDQRRRLRRARGLDHGGLVGIGNAPSSTQISHAAFGAARRRRRHRRPRNSIGTDAMRRAFAPQLVLRRRGRDHQHAERNEIAAHAIPARQRPANPARTGVLRYR